MTAEMLHNPMNSELVVMTRGKHGRYSMLPFHGEEWLRGFGLDDMMIQDQKWQQNARLYDLNEDWPTSSPTWFDNLGERIEGILAQEEVTQTPSGAQSRSAEITSSKWPRGSDPMRTFDEVLSATEPDRSSENDSTK